MLEALWIDMTAFLGVVYVISPVVLRYTMRYPVKCNPKAIALKDAPVQVAGVLGPRISELESLGFECLGAYDCGSLSSSTRSFNAYFCNRATSDFASVTVMETSEGQVSYLEFSTSFANGAVVETNTNGMPPLSPDRPTHRVFRFSEIQTAAALYRLHRELLKKYAPGLWPVAEPKNEELKRFMRVIENFGPRHARIGYMELAEDGESYMPTWKGACLMAWRSLWPISFVRRAWNWHSMRSELGSLQVRGFTALKKA
jgi:hypothetical protein